MSGHPNRPPDTAPPEHPESLTLLALALRGGLDLAADLLRQRNAAADGSALDTAARAHALAGARRIAVACRLCHLSVPPGPPARDAALYAAGRVAYALTALAAAHPDELALLTHAELDALSADDNLQEAVATWHAAAFRRAATS